MCAWNRWVEQVRLVCSTTFFVRFFPDAPSSLSTSQNSPARMHPKNSLVYIVGFVKRYFKTLDDLRLFPFFVVHLKVSCPFLVQLLSRISRR